MLNAAQKTINEYLCLDFSSQNLAELKKMTIFAPILSVKNND